MSCKARFTYILFVKCPSLAVRMFSHCPTRSRFCPSYICLSASFILSVPEDAVYSNFQTFKYILIYDCILSVPENA